MLKCRVLVFVFTARKYHERRMAIFDTWFLRLTKVPDIHPVLVMNDPELPEGTAKLDEYLLSIGGEESYRKLPIKARTACQWAMKRVQFDYVFKCDDDTYLHVERLAAYNTAGKDYIGFDPNDRISPWFASGGGGYWLSRRAVKIVAKGLVERDGLEDWLIGLLMKKHSIALFDDKRFYTWNDRKLWPKPENDMITGHYITPVDMRAIHAGLYDQPVG